MLYTATPRRLSGGDSYVFLSDSCFNNCYNKGFAFCSDLFLRARIPSACQLCPDPTVPYPPKIVMIVMGRNFSVCDLLAYSLGLLTSYNKIYPKLFYTPST